MKQKYNFSEFQKSSRNDWLNKATADLKGKSSLDKFNWTPDMGIVMTPFSEAEDLEGIVPGATQNSVLNAKLHRSQPWENFEFISAEDPKANNQTLDSLNNGADGLIVDQLKGSNIDSVLKNVLPEHCSISLINNDNDISSLKCYLDWINANHGGKNIKGLCFAEQLGHAHLSGSKKLEFNDNLLDVTQDLKQYPNLRTFMIDSTGIEACGGGIISQLGISLSMMVYTINHLREKNMSLDEIVKRMFINISVGSSFFDELAKIRALRYLSSAVINAYEPTGIENHIHIHGSVSLKNKSRLDVDSNLLRSTSEAMSAVLGGVDSLHVWSFSNADSSNRISRNVSNILKEESYLDKVIDPSAGSYFIESLSDKMAGAAWDYFQEVETAGGIEQALSDGLLINRIDHERNLKFEQLKNARSSMIGVNNYGNTLETYAHTNWSNPNGSADEFRNARPFEDVRELVESHVTANGASSRPKVVPVVIGDNLAMRSARVNFTLNFFSWAGFEVTNEMSIQELDQNVGVCTVVICGADDDYDSLDKSFIENTINTHDDSFVLFAGKMPDFAKPHSSSSRGRVGAINRKSDRLTVIKDIIDHQLTNHG